MPAAGKANAAGIARAHDRHRHGAPQPSAILVRVTSSGGLGVAGNRTDALAAIVQSYDRPLPSGARRGSPRRYRFTVQLAGSSQTYTVTAAPIETFWLYDELTEGTRAKVDENTAQAISDRKGEEVEG